MKTFGFRARRLHDVARVSAVLSTRSPQRSQPSYGCARPRGFSLIELMVGIVLGLLLLIGLTTMFVASSRSFSETERASRQIENGRYALDLLSEDIRHAGFFGEASSFGTPPVGAPPDPCSTTLAALQTALTVPIQGVDYVPGTADPSGKLPSCVPDHVAGTD